MNKTVAKAKFVSYLKEHGIKYSERLRDGDACILMVFNGYKSCPNEALEASIYFFETCMEARVYYTETASSWIDKAENLADLYRLLNFINACVWPCAQDGIGGELYYPHHLHTPRFYITEDGGNDLTSTTVIDYDYYEVAPLETEDFITAALPELMDKLSIPFFFLLLNRMTVDQAIHYIKSEILEEL
ncbi:MAG TPA: hypothetical protein GXZ70_02730 [Clostridiales bacterium]|nr:hypothetical protein [Clostridiales bacterium]